MTKISVIIAVYNALEDVKLLLQSILKNFNFYLGEIILLNDCSDNETKNYLEQFTQQHPQFNLIHNSENLGFVKTCNKGMLMSKGEIVILLNSDTIIPKGFVEKIIRCFNSDKQIGIASPISSYSAKYFIPLPKNFNIEDMNTILQKKHKTIYPEILTCEGFCYCIRRDVIKELGYLDEIYGIGYYEETDYSYRAYVNGWKNVLIDNLYIYHKRNASFGNKIRSEQYRTNRKICKSRYDIVKKIKKADLDDKIIEKIEQELFPIKRFFSKRISKKHKIFKILGIKFKIRNQVKNGE